MMKILRNDLYLDVYFSVSMLSKTPMCVFIGIACLSTKIKVDNLGLLVFWNVSLRNSDITSASWRLESPLTWQLVQDNSNDNIEALYLWHFESSSWHNVDKIDAHTNIVPRNLRTY